MRPRIVAGRSSSANSLAMLLYSTSGFAQFVSVVVPAATAAFSTVSTWGVSSQRLAISADCIRLPLPAISAIA